MKNHLRVKTWKLKIFMKASKNNKVFPKQVMR